MFQKLNNRLVEILFLNITTLNKKTIERVIIHLR